MTTPPPTRSGPDAPGSSDGPPSPPPTWGPTTVGGSRRRRRWLLVPLLLLGLVAGSIGAVAAAGLGSLGRVEVTTLAGSGGAVTHTLVVGSDSRDDLTPEQLAELGTGAVEGLRTDTIFILSTQGGRAAILALPRDLWVTRCDGSEGRINSAHARGGPDCLVQTVQQATGIGIDHYLEVGFPGFIDLVGAVGGVEVCLDAPIKDAYAAVDLPAGCHTLTGPQALGYVRVRKIDNDLMRIQRQQGFISALADKAMQPSVLLNPFRAVAVARAAGGALTADDGMGPLDLLRLARGGRGLASGAYVATTVPVTGTTISGAAVLLPTDGAAALYASFADGTIFDQIGAPVDAEG